MICQIDFAGSKIVKAHTRVQKQTTGCVKLHKAAVSGRDERTRQGNGAEQGMKV